MSKLSFSFVLFLVLIITVVGGAVFLLMWDIPAPLEPMAITVPNDRFPA